MKSNPSSSAIRFTLDSSESRGFFLFSPFLIFRMFWISEADFLFPLRFPLSAYGCDEGLYPVSAWFPKQIHHKMCCGDDAHLAVLDRDQCALLLVNPYRSPQFRVRWWIFREYDCSNKRFSIERVTKRIVIQNIFVRRGLGREPQQAEKYTRAVVRFMWFFVFVGTQALLAPLRKTVFPWMKLDNHFTHLVFWILHEMDMMKP